MSDSKTSFKDHFLNFDLDRCLNPYIPHNRLYLLPKPVSHWLGYRETPAKEPHKILQWPITFLATIAGLCLVAGIGQYAPGISKWHPPVIIASLGASAVLEFNTIKSPLGQPRNAVVGNTLAAIMGVCAAKLFQLNPAFESIQWVSAAVGCALASLLMSATDTVHPPGGATAFLASTEMNVLKMGWMFVPIVLLDSILIQVVALIFNNILRSYPVYWWTGANVGRQLKEEKRNEEKKAEEGKAGKEERQSSLSDASSDITLQREPTNQIEFVDELRDVQITASSIQLPHHLQLSDQETMLLQRVQQKIAAQSASK